MSPSQLRMCFYFGQKMCLLPIDKNDRVDGNEIIMYERDARFLARIFKQLFLINVTARTFNAYLTKNIKCKNKILKLKEFSLGLLHVTLQI